jgi:hypothetical protein
VRKAASGEARNSHGIAERERLVCLEGLKPPRPKEKNIDARPGEPVLVDDTGLGIQEWTSLMHGPSLTGGQSAMKFRHAEPRRPPLS